MKKITKNIVLCSFIVLVIFMGIVLISDCFQRGKRFEGNVPNVIILVWSGVRLEESLGDKTGQYIPHLKNELLPEGTLYSNMYDYNYEFHVCTVVAMLSGNPCYHYNYDLHRVLAEYPTVFQYARKKYKDSASKYWEIGSFGAYTAFCDRPRFRENTRPCVLRASLFPYPAEVDKLLCNEILPLLNPEEKLYYDVMSDKELLYFWDAIDEVDFRMFKKVFYTYKPRIMLFNINSLDISHVAHWAKYVTTLRRTDEITWEIWNMIQEDPFYRNNTYLIVTPDHERNRYFMNHSENNSDNPSHVWAYLYGPNVYKGKQVDRKTSHLDICNTVAYIMNFDAEYSKGQLLKEAFK
ncbi:MAG: hypothetical protein KKH94_00585 [Candidatus Omnitrophica bacterium]|nr:hypothetical protein [Candidatus Omnitrophota bacterium]